MAIAIICDIRGSRKIANWGKVYSNIEKKLEKLNKEFQNEIIVPVRFTVGDEFQGVFKNPENIVDIIRFLKVHITVGFYCGIGTGDIELPIEDMKAMRGTAFYRARNAIEICKKKKRDFYFKTDVNFLDAPLNAILYLIHSIESGWTERQREIANFYRLNPLTTYEEIGRHFGVTRQTIMKILKAAKFHAIKEGEEAIRELLKGVNQIGFTYKNNL